MSAPFLPRKTLPHDIPSWVQQGALYYISFNVANRPEKPLIAPLIANALLQGLVDYEHIHRWYIRLAVVMPDHIHMIATFNLREEVKKTVCSWRAYHARKLGLDWQKDFFEHRLRSENSLEEKSFYIRMNPVRQGLCTVPEQWPYIIDRMNIDEGKLEK